MLLILSYNYSCPFGGIWVSYGKKKSKKGKPKKYIYTFFIHKLKNLCTNELFVIYTKLMLRAWDGAGETLYSSKMKENISSRGTTYTDDEQFLKQ